MLCSIIWLSRTTDDYSLCLTAHGCWKLSNSVPWNNVSWWFVRMEYSLMIRVRHPSQQSKWQGSLRGKSVPINASICVYMRLHVTGDQASERMWNPYSVRKLGLDSNTSTHNLPFDEESGKTFHTRNLIDPSRLWAFILLTKGPRNPLGSK